MSPLENRSLQDWYLALNRIYLDRNFHRGRFEIFAHLVEVVGAVSLLASDKSKPDVDPEAFASKALAWWFALCGKMSVRNVAEMVWWKFPNVCPYCYEHPHNELKCKVGDGPHKLDWRLLDELAVRNQKQRPKTLAEWQQMFFGIYPITKGEKYPAIFGRFAEELGEIAETLRVAPAAPGYFLSEAADFFAWFMHLQNRIDLQKGLGSTLGSRLASSFADAYPDKCLDCRNPVCTCRPILPGTLGRIAHEMPQGNASFVQGGALISPEEVMEAFRTGVSQVRIGEQEFSVTLTMIHDIKNLVDGIRQQLTAQSQLSTLYSTKLDSVLERVDGLATAQRVTQESMDQLIEAFAALPSESRQTVLAILSNIAAAPWAATLVEVVKRLSGA